MDIVIKRAFYCLLLLTAAPCAVHAEGTFAVTQVSSQADEWKEENAYWRSNYPSRPYYDSALLYSAFEPAVHYGFDLYQKNPTKHFEDLSQEELRNGWEKSRESSALGWDDVQLATREAFNRMAEKHVPGGNPSPDVTSGIIPLDKSAPVNGIPNANGPIPERVMNPLSTPPTENITKGQ